MAHKTRIARGVAAFEFALVVLAAGCVDGELSVASPRAGNAGASGNGAAGTPADGGFGGSSGGAGSGGVAGAGGSGTAGRGGSAGGAGGAVIGACTDGVDCFCDLARAQMADVLFCEDFEDPAWSEPGLPNSAYATSGPNRRGSAGIAMQTFGQGGVSCVWNDDEPQSPNLGVACDYDTFGTEPCGVAVWVPGDLYQAPTQNSHGPSTGNYACVGMLQRGDNFAEEIPGMTAPTAPCSACGNRVLFQRVAEGNGTSTWPRCEGGCAFDRAVAGIWGSVDLENARHIGVTQMLGFPSNIMESQIFAAPWKFNQYGSQDGGHHYMWNLGNLNNFSGDDRLLPYRPGWRTTDCAAATAAAVAEVGGFRCSGSASLTWGPTLDTINDVNNHTDSAYNQEWDFPWGEYACHRAEIGGLGGPRGNTDGFVKIWHNDELIVHIRNLDTSYFPVQHMEALKMNNYANINQQTGYRTTMVTGRYEDNLLIVRDGAPPTCAELGMLP